MNQTSLRQLCIDNEVEVIFDMFVNWCDENVILSNERKTSLNRDEFFHQLDHGTIEDQLYWIMKFVSKKIITFEIQQNWFTEPQQQIIKTFKTIKSIHKC